MIVDARIQHPTQRFLRHDMFDSALGLGHETRALFLGANARAVFGLD